MTPAIGISALICQTGTLAGLYTLVSWNDQAWTKYGQPYQISAITAGK